MAYPSSTLYPGLSVFPGMSVNGGDEPEPTGSLQWNSIKDRQIETGVDRGVLYLNDGRVVPWNGLTSVDEQGGEAATVYFLDGRPFLSLPKPKEFLATIKAFMYPDAFSEILGEVEVADGMYLDSQQGDSFGLSYRTLIADAIKGTDAGYKIHLVYNATVVPSAKSFNAIGDSITPVDFSWDIQGIPLQVVGYRPTAHVTIDTRHMDAERIAAVEELLYGSNTVAASLPHPQTIFDMLNFGDMIIITDNGDGTWEAEGSYKNIIIIGDGLFEIHNVNGTDHGDGTYTISTTP